MFVAILLETNYIFEWIGTEQYFILIWKLALSTTTLSALTQWLQSDVPVQH